MKMRAAFGYDVDEASCEACLECNDPSLAVQSAALDADINEIVRRFGVTGQLPQVTMPPTFADFTDGVRDYHSAMNTIREAQNSFMSLDAEVRLRFNNDPGAFVAFCESDGNRDELRKMGLLNETVRDFGAGDNGTASESGPS
jgi:phage internal scaffolding protein